jgi:hypothetical protein
MPAISSSINGMSRSMMSAAGGGAMERKRLCILIATDLDVELIPAAG